MSSRELQWYYERDREHERLTRGVGQLEFERSKELILRHLPPSPAAILDLGGGTGPYSFWLSGLGYSVHLIDAMPLHIERARELGRRFESHSVTFEAGDARRLRQQDFSFDAALLLGPLYHLTEHADRLRALAEVGRVLQPGAPLFAAGISRFASALDGLFGDLHQDPQFRRIVRQDLATGEHVNPTRRPSYFTDSYFHRPKELEEELLQAGFDDVSVLAVEGPAALLQNFDDHWTDPDRRRLLMETVRALESEPSVLGVSSHLLAVGWRPTAG